MCFEGTFVFEGDLLVVGTSVCVCFITAGPITKLFAWGEEESVLVVIFINGH